MGTMGITDMMEVMEVILAMVGTTVTVVMEAMVVTVAEEMVVVAINNYRIAHP